MTTPSWRALGLGAAAAAILVFATHAVVLTFGLRFDDYMMLRPLGGTDIRQILTGNWGPVGDFLDPYYRPITSLYLAGLFDTFGLHAWAMHVVSLIELWLVACLMGLFIWRDAGRMAAAVAVVAYVMHPVLPDSTSAWIGNQMHLLALLVVASTLLIWQRRRQDPRPRAWWPIFALTIVGVFVKEDTAMVLPAVLLQWGRARVVGDVPSVARPLLLAAGAVVVVLALHRLLVFPRFDVFGPGEPRTWLTIATIAAYGPLRSSAAMFLGGTIAVGATAFVLMLQVFGAHHARRDPASPTGWLWIQSAVLLVCFSLPLAFVFDIKSTRQHLAVFAAAMMWAAGTQALRAWLAATRRAWLVAGTVVLLAGGADLARLQHTALVDRFSPCGEEDLWFDHDTRAWPVIPDDLKQWFAQKEQACADGRYRPLEQTMEQVRWRVEDRRVILIHAGAARVTLRIQRGATPLTSATVIVDGVTHQVPLTGDFNTVMLPLRWDWRVWLRAAHRLDLRVDGDTSAVVASEIGWSAPR